MAFWKSAPNPERSRSYQAAASAATAVNLTPALPFSD
jgi:hypothetical protein